MAEKILFVDDDESLIEVCETGLRMAGYEVTTASSGEEAVKLVDAGSFDLVITDLKMPGSVDGVGVVRHVKTARPLTDAMVITGTPTLQTAIATLKEGAYDYIIKPFVIDHLKVVVRRCLDSRRLKEELSSERAMRQELKAAYEELQKVEQLKEAIMARVSHELKTPLSELTMALHLMEELGDRSAQAEKKKRHYLDLAKAAYLRLERTLSNLLSFSDLGKPMALQSSVPVGLEDLCRGVAESMRTLSEPRGLKVSLDFEPGLPPVAGAPGLLEKAFQHLVHNAIIFNREGGEVRIAGKASRGRVQVTVEDTGEGIPESEFNQIFDSFYQVANYLTRRVDGLGLGLAIARRILEVHGGSVSVASKIGVGSTFTVDLPAAKAPPG